MEREQPLLTSLTDGQLLARVTMLAAHERHATAALIAALAELDARRLFLSEGYPSLFAYCTQALHLSEDAAYNRIRAARVALKWPVVLDLLADGSVTLTAVRLLSDVLTDSNHQEVFRAATCKSKRDVESLIAALNPQPPVAPMVRKIPTPLPPADSPDVPTLLVAPTPVPANPAPADARPAAPMPAARPAQVAPLSPDNYRIQFTISKDTHDKLRRVQDLMRHSNPHGDPAAIFDRALTALLEQLEKTKLGKVTRPRNHQSAPRPGSRHVPSTVKRAVWTRDSGRCAFVGATGRCAETGFLEYHHVIPFADGGQTNPSNIQLRCRAHNAHEAEQWFGPMVVREHQPHFSDVL